jgi:hypothetical protein
VQFHILSFEGPDPYSRAGSLATRVEGLSATLAGLGYETHVWFVGDPELPGHETRGALHLHRWAQWVSRHHRAGVYDGEQGKRSEYARTLPPHLFDAWLRPHLGSGGRGVVLAEEWQTVDCVFHLDCLLQRARLRDRVALLWNANSTFGFETIDWRRLVEAARITTVSRYMKQRMWPLGVDPLVVPNGLSGEAFDAPDRAGCAELRRRFRDRSVVAKLRRWAGARCWWPAAAPRPTERRSGPRCGPTGWRAWTAPGGNPGRGGCWRGSAISTAPTS